MRKRGATLTEILVVIVMIGIMTVIALPTFGRMQRQWRLDSAAHQLAGDLHRARVEALKRNDNVFLATTGASTYTIRFLGDRQLPEGVTFADDVPDTVRFAAFGPALTGAAKFQVLMGDHNKEISLNVAGFAAVQ